MEVKLEGAKITSIASFHAEIKRAIGLPDYYGENLDALWDCITGYIELPMTLIWVDHNISRSHLGAYADQIVSLFKEADTLIDGFSVQYR